MSRRSVAVLRAAGGVILVAVIAYFVIGYVQDYRADQSIEPVLEITSTDPAKAAVQPAQTSSKVVVVLIDGLNFRSAADAQAKAIRGLKKGEQLSLIEKSSGWYHERDANNKEGWVSANPQYLEVRDATP